MPKTRPPYSPAFRRQMVPLIGAGAVLSPHSPRTVIAGEEFTVEVRGVFDDVEDISAVRYMRRDDQGEKPYCLTGGCSRDVKRCLTKRAPVASRSSGRAAALF